MSHFSTYAALIERLGFVADPFDKTNADEEELLDSYFIQPPFYSAVFGDPASPKSAIVFAPRGGGKTALKRKIELASQGSDFLCVTYNTFSTEGVSLKNIKAEYHLQNVLRLVLIGVIGECNEQGSSDCRTKNGIFSIFFAKRIYRNLIAASSKPRSMQLRTSQTGRATGGTGLQDR